MNGLSFVPLAIMALAAVTVFAHVLRFPDRDWTPAEGRRIKWSLIAMAFWMVTTRWLASEGFHPCQVDARLLSIRGGSGSAAFLDCSPQLLSSGPAAASLFFWLWAPMALVAALCLRHLARVAAAGKEKAR
jgi:hypothetical protein